MVFSTFGMFLNGKNYPPCLLYPLITHARNAQKKNKSSSIFINATAEAQGLIQQIADYSGIKATTAFLKSSAHKGLGMYLSAL